MKLQESLWNAQLKEIEATLPFPSGAISSLQATKLGRALLEPRGAEQDALRKPGWF